MVFYHLTHWGRVMHICVSKPTILGSDNGLSPDRRQTIIWTNAGILLIGTLKTNFSEMLIEIHTFSLKKMHLKMSSGKWRPFCLGLNVLTHWRLARQSIYVILGISLTQKINTRISPEVWYFICTLIEVRSTWMKMFEFCLTWYLSLFPGFKLTIFQHCFR